MMRLALLVVLAALAATKSIDKRQVNGNYGFGGGSAPSLDASFNAAAAPSQSSGSKCRDETKYILTWTKVVIPVTVYDTRTEFLPTTLYKYVTETEYYPVTVVQLETTTRAGGVEYGEETKVSYRTNTVVLPQIKSITSTLVFTEDEHVTATETDTLTRTEAQQYPVTVTVTSTDSQPQIETSVQTEYSTQYQTQYTTQQYEVVQTQTVNQPQVQYITNTVTRTQVRTQVVTSTKNNYQTVTSCAQQQPQGYPQF